MMTRILNVFRTAKSTAKTATPRPAANLRLENLETRSLMAASVTASLTNGVLKIDGTQGNDRIVVREQGGQLRIDNVAIKTGGKALAHVSSKAVKSVIVDAKGGNDVVNLSVAAQAVTKSAVIRGGTGNDSLTGTAAKDVLFGGTGADRFVASRTDIVADATRQDTVVRNTAAIDAALTTPTMDRMARPVTSAALSLKTSSVVGYRVSQVKGLDSAAAYRTNNYYRVAGIQVAYNTANRMFAIAIPNSGFGVITGRYTVQNGMVIFVANRSFYTAGAATHMHVEAAIVPANKSGYRVPTLVVYVRSGKNMAAVVNGTGFGQSGGNYYVGVATLRRM